eukprot:TRINITY_DN4862_c0_g1_i1.p1 TRINITY_DN4862_c0_g1~~TRINITY_DN4862_c0_g1_i1.p1  ORF type:complete len:967 (+),score=262.73 TRINITY_DN4862_c0_g1_i1:72-2903(+)
MASPPWRGEGSCSPIRTPQPRQRSASPSLPPRYEPPLSGVSELCCSDPSARVLLRALPHPGESPEAFTDRGGGPVACLPHEDGAGLRLVVYDPDGGVLLDESLDDNIYEAVGTGLEWVADSHGLRIRVVFAELAHLGAVCAFLTDHFGHAGNLSGAPPCPDVLAGAHVLDDFRRKLCLPGPSAVDKWCLAESLVRRGHLDRLLALVPPSSRGVTHPLFDTFVGLLRLECSEVLAAILRDESASEKALRAWSLPSRQRMKREARAPGVPPSPVSALSPQETLLRGHLIAWEDAVPAAMRVDPEVRAAVRTGVRARFVREEVLADSAEPAVRQQLSALERSCRCELLRRILTEPQLAAAACGGPCAGEPCPSAVRLARWTAAMAIELPVADRAGAVAVLIDRGLGATLSAAVWRIEAALQGGEQCGDLADELRALLGACFTLHGETRCEESLTPWRRWLRTHADGGCGRALLRLSARLAVAGLDDSGCVWHLLGLRDPEGSQSADRNRDADTVREREEFIDWLHGEARCPFDALLEPLGSSPSAHALEHVLPLLSRSALLHGPAARPTVQRHISSGRLSALVSCAIRRGGSAAVCGLQTLGALLCPGDQVGDSATRRFAGACAARLAQQGALPAAAGALHAPGGVGHAALHFFLSCREAPAREAALLQCDGSRPLPGPLRERYAADCEQGWQRIGEQLPGGVLGERTPVRSARRRGGSSLSPVAASLPFSPTLSPFSASGADAAYCLSGPPTPPPRQQQQQQQQLQVSTDDVSGCEGDTTVTCEIELSGVTRTGATAVSGTPHSGRYGEMEEEADVSPPCWVSPHPPCEGGHSAVLLALALDAAGIDIDIVDRIDALTAMVTEQIRLGELQWGKRQPPELPPPRQRKRRQQSQPQPSPGSAAKQRAARKGESPGSRSRPRSPSAGVGPKLGRSGVPLKARNLNLS